MLMVCLVGGTYYCRSFTLVAEAISLQSTNVYSVYGQCSGIRKEIFVKGDYVFTLNVLI